LSTRKVASHRPINEKSLIVEDAVEHVWMVQG
jgi:hypothetical protein